MDPACVVAAITPKTKAIMPVSLYGLSANLTALSNIAKSHQLPLINDAAQAFGAICSSKNINELADITSYSLENSKHITTGDGGIVVTDNEDLAVSMRKFGSLSYSAMKAGDGRIRLNKSIFQDPSYSRHDDVGLNYRMPEVAAALGLAQVERVDMFINKRIQNASLLDDVASTCDWLTPQMTPDNYKHSQWTYVVRICRDDIDWYEFKERFNQFGGDGPFGCWKITYQEDLFTQRAYHKLNPSLYAHLEYPDGLCPIAESIQPKLLQFPTNQGSASEIQQQCDALEKTIQSFN